VVELTDPGPTARWTPPPAAEAPLAVALLQRPLDLTWRRTSYSALTRDAHEQRLGSEPEPAARDDETDLEVSPEPAPDDPDQALAAVTSRWAELPGGAGFGTLVHAVLERLADPADEAQVRAAVATGLGPGSAPGEQDALADGLMEALATPLGPLADGLALRDVPARDRLAELEFELPLAGGDRPAAAPPGLLADLVPLWRQYCPDGPLAGYADVLTGLEPVPLRGYLTGSIDAVLRVGPGASRRYVVVDYKTNRLGPTDEPLTAWHYRPTALAGAMIEAHYPLQALLYCVALHRYLRWRSPGYDPQAQLGGALYLFLRGMVPGRVGADGSAPGVFAWRPPAGLVLATSQLLAGPALVTT
jgi:exodeoxyribonuclease V beta subunit